ncbi:MAG: aldehyde ferredoxin oxidoreductase family protein [Synergistales bacterium]|nr:aldehyde ferredoxin oxidoreductase family protein [Synergistales bacterium]
MTLWKGIRTWVDLSSRSARKEELPESYARKWGGMRGLALPVLLERLSRDTDPLGPDNPLVIACGLLNGLAFHGLSRYGLYARSPLTGAYGESEAGGYFGPGLKGQGIESIVLEGRSEEPVYLWVENGEVSIRDAGFLWGLETGPAMDKLKEEHGRITAIMIGPAGEKLVRYSCVLNDLHHANGRTGMGAVMGSKRVKAIACPHPKPEEPFDRELLKKMHEAYRGWKDIPFYWALREFGTTASVEGNNDVGMLPTRNFREGVFEGASKVGCRYMNENMLIDRYACFSCAVRCKRVVSGGKHDVDPTYGGPEYETIGAFGPLCGIDDLETIAKAHEICNRTGLDTISTGATIAWWMECVEEGILSPEEAEIQGFGDTEGLLPLVRKIAAREGIGDLLAEGVRRASERIGKGSGKFALHVKGQELPLHDPRGKYGLALAYALAPGGADHMQFPHDPLFSKEGSVPMEAVKCLGVTEALPTLSLDEKKTRAVTYLWLSWSMMNHLGMCYFVFASRGYFPHTLVPSLVESALGWKTSLWELMKMAERGLTAARLVNLKLGFGAKDDILPDRLFEPIPEGPLEGKSVPEGDFWKARDLYYQFLGWDQKGIPSEAKLIELGLDAWMSIIKELKIQ